MISDDSLYQFKALHSLYIELIRDNLRKHTKTIAILGAMTAEVTGVGRFWGRKFGEAEAIESL